MHHKTATHPEHDTAERRVLHIRVSNEGDDDCRVVVAGADCKGREGGAVILTLKFCETIVGLMSL